MKTEINTLNKPIILCVDDEPIILQSLKEELKHEFKKDADIAISYSSEDALQFIKKIDTQKTDLPLVISDQVMPGMKGDELLTKIHTLSPKTLNILLTGQANVDDIGKAVNNAKLYRYITKPWDHDDLILTVKEALHSYFQDKRLDEKNKLLQVSNNKLEVLNIELERKINLFNKFIPYQFLEILNLHKDKDHIALGEHSSRNLSMMFIDIHSFTTYCEYLSPHAVFEFINHYINIAGPIIEKNNGFVDKYLGDGILAIFLNPEDAIAAGIDLSHAKLEFKVGGDQNKMIHYSTGIGINTGDVIIGTVGNEERIATTVIGDSVNIAFRIESLTSFYGTPLLVTSPTIKNIKDYSQFNLRNIDKIIIKGRQKALEIFEVLNALPAKIKEEKLRSIHIFEEARLAYLEQNYGNAKALFKKCLKICPEDIATKIYLGRLAHQK